MQQRSIRKQQVPGAGTQERACRHDGESQQQKLTTALIRNPHECSNALKIDTAAEAEADLGAAGQGDGLPTARSVYCSMTVCPL